MPTVAEAFRSAVAHHEAGQPAEAEALYTRILAVAPDHAGCLHRLGGLALETGRHDLAIALIGRAMAIDDREPVYPNTLGNVLYAQGRLDEAAAQYRRALALKPDYAGALYNLGNVLQAQGRAAAALLRQLQGRRIARCEPNPLSGRPKIQLSCSMRLRAFGRPPMADIAGLPSVAISLARPGTYPPTPGSTRLR